MIELRWFIRVNGEKVLQYLRDGLWINITTEFENASIDEPTQEYSHRGNKRKQVDNHSDRVDTNAPRKTAKRRGRPRVA